MEQKAELLINFHSRSSRQAYERIVYTLENAGFTLTYINKITKDVSLHDLLAGAEKRKPKLLIIGGGDGTISDVVDHLVGAKIDIGIIPLGTTNNFARSLRIPLDIDGAVAVIKNQPARTVTLGKMQDDYFTNVAGIGLSALIARNVTDKAKKRWGRFAYAIVGMQQMFLHQPFLATIRDKDSELVVHTWTRQLIVANGRYHAGKLIADDTSTNDGQLVVFSLGNKSMPSFLWNMFDFYVGKRAKVSDAAYFIGSNIVVETSTPQQIELDGEIKFETPVTAKVSSGTIKVRHPQ